MEGEINKAFCSAAAILNDGEVRGLHRDRRRFRAVTTLNSNQAYAHEMQTHACADARAHTLNRGAGERSSGCLKRVLEFGPHSL